jgi:hypothetical protein
MFKLSPCVFPWFYKVFFNWHFFWNEMTKLLRGVRMRNFVMKDLLKGRDWSASLRSRWHIDLIVHDKVMKSIAEIINRTVDFLIPTIIFI